MAGSELRLGQSANVTVLKAGDFVNENNAIMCKECGSKRVRISSCEFCGCNFKLGEASNDCTK